MAAIGFASLLAGCMGSTPSGPQDVNVDRTGATATANGVNVTIVLEDCFGMILGTTVPEAWATPLVPEGFTARPLAGPGYDARLRAHSCARAILNETVIEDVRWLNAQIVVYQDVDNSTNRQVALVVATFVSHDELGDALGQVGLKPHVGTIEVTQDEQVAGTKRIDWSGRGPDFAFDFGYLSQQSRQSQGSPSPTTWHAGPPVVRNTQQGSEALTTAADLDGIMLTSSGENNMSRLLGNNERWAFVAQERLEASYEYRLERWQHES